MPPGEVRLVEVDLHDHARPGRVAGRDTGTRQDMVGDRSIGATAARSGRSRAVPNISACSRTVRRWSLASEIRELCGIITGQTRSPNRSWRFSMTSASATPLCWRRQIEIRERRSRSSSRGPAPRAPGGQSGACPRHDGHPGRWPWSASRAGRRPPTTGDDRVGVPGVDHRPVVCVRDHTQAALDQEGAALGHLEHRVHVGEPR